MNRFLKHLPLYYRKSSIAQSFFNAIAAEFKRLDAFKEKLKDERYISTSTVYLAEREKALGLNTPEITAKIMSNYTVEKLENYTVEELETMAVSDSPALRNQWLDYRRSRIRARLRGIGTVNEALIKKIAESYTDGEVDIVCDYSNYNVTINSVSYTHLTLPTN